MSDERPIERGEAVEHGFDEELRAVQPGPENLELRDLSNVRLRITADLGQCKTTVRDVLALREGSVLPLDKLAGEMADIYVNGLPLARGEVVVLVDGLSVRVAEITGMDDVGWGSHG